MPQPKTNKEWLSEIPDRKVREAATRNLLNQHGDKAFMTTDFARSLKVALPRMFEFVQTPEGKQYWLDVCKELPSDGGPMPKEPNIL